MSKTKEFVETLREIREACSQLSEAIADLNDTLARINADESQQEIEVPKRDVKADKELIQQHQLADKQIAANILKVTKGTTGPSLDDLDQQLEDQQLLLLSMSTHNKNVEQLTEQVQALRKQREQLIQQEIDHDIKRSNLKNIQSFF